MSRIFWDTLAVAHESATETLQKVYDREWENEDQDRLRKYDSELSDLIAECNILVDTLESTDEQFRAVMDNMTGKERTQLNSECEEFFVRVPYKITIMKLKLRLAKLNSIQRQVQVRISSLVPVVSSPRDVGESSMPLPKLKLPTFDGDITKWRSFWDRFKFSVEDRNYPPVAKLEWLLSCLKGPPLDSVQGLPIENKSYEDAVGRLKREYGSETLIIQSLYQKLEQSIVVKPDCSNLRKFINDIEDCVLQLEHLNEGANTPMVHMAIYKKLPRDVLESVLQVSDLPATNNESKTVHILNKLKEIVGCKERANCVLGPSVKAMFDHSVKTAKPVKSLTFSAVSSRACLFCNKNGHKAINCFSFPDIESRKSRLKELRACFKCGKTDHFANNCKLYLSCERCKGKHSSFLCYKHLKGHPKSVNPGDSLRSVEPAYPALDEIASAEVSNSVVSKTPVLLKCLRARVANPEDPSKSVEALIMLDDGSTCSYVTLALVRQLNLRRLGSTNLSLGVFNSANTKLVSSGVVSFNLSLKEGGTMNIVANTLEVLTRKVPHQLVDDGAMQDMSVVNCSWGTPDILIGGDFYYDLDLVVEKQLPSGLMILNSKLGWIAAGRVRGEDSANVAITMDVVNEKRFEESMSQFFELESIGIKDSTSKSFSLDRFCESIRKVDGRYEVMLPWKEFPPNLPCNFALSFGRLRSVKRSLDKNLKLLHKYDEVIKNQLNDGVIEEIPFDERQVDFVHYLPHQAVVNEEKCKLRVVYDGSAKCSKLQKSLNDCLESGPILIENLVGILLRFRIPPVVVICDIEKAFLQVGLNCKDRDFTRFLWLKELSEPVTLQNLCVYRFNRVPFGLTCSPFLLAVTLLHHLGSISSASANEILGNIYVDNVMLPCSDVTSAQKKCAEVKDIFAKGCMNVREFASNDFCALAGMGKTDVLSGHSPKFLGIPWLTDTDSLSFSLPNVELKVAWTKRKILQIIASLFDPLGLLCPINLSAKLFLQSLWKDQIGWDVALSVEMTNHWLELSAVWSGQNIKVSRSVKHGDQNDSCLHCFVDASYNAFACCVYLVSKNTKYECSSNLIFAKTKVRPARLEKDFSIHKMELLAASIGIKALEFVQKELDKENFAYVSLSKKLTLWTDSSTVLHWLRGTSKQSVFVENRLRSIRSIKNLVCHYVASEDNPADTASRGCCAEGLRMDKRWWHGPEWLTSRSMSQKSDIPSFDSNLYVESLVCVSSSEPPVINASRFSKWFKLVKTTAYVLRFLSKVSKRDKLIGPLKYLCVKDFPESICLSEHRNASLLLFLLAQKEKPPSDDVVASLSLTKDHLGLFRVRGRLHKSHLNANAKNPVLLDRKCYITQLWVLYIHETFLHAGPLLTLSHTRFCCWIPSGKRAVSSIIRNGCQICKRFVAPSYGVPDSPPLPEERVRPSRPFQNVGVDYCGPLNIISSGESRKTWIVLFTCLSVRAVHLEVTTTLSAEGFLSVLRKFCARRGSPQRIISDNGTQFVLTAKMLHVKFRSDFMRTLYPGTIAEYLVKRGIVWQFITERAPWRGGFYERLIASVKHHLRRLLVSKACDYELFTAIVSEIEYVINTRPISFVSDSDTSHTPVLRPIDFILRNTEGSDRLLCEPPEEISIDCDIPKTSNHQLLEIWKRDGEIVNEFWREWHKDYLLALRERMRRLSRKKVRMPVVGEAVLVYDDNQPRSLWKVARVVRAEASEDGIVRTCKIKLPSGSITNRAVQHLFPLETADESEQN